MINGLSFCLSVHSSLVFVSVVLFILVAYFAFSFLPLFIQGIFGHWFFSESLPVMWWLVQQVLELA